jgi:hypothetical protein
MTMLDYGVGSDPNTVSFVGLPTAACVAIYLHVPQYAIKESVRGVVAYNSAIGKNKNSQTNSIIPSQHQLEEISRELSMELSSVNKDKGDDCDSTNINDEEDMEITDSPKFGAAPRASEPP